jgi:hypothetical protein
MCPYCHCNVDIFIIESCQRPVCVKSYQVHELDPSEFDKLFPDTGLSDEDPPVFEKTVPGELMFLPKNKKD